MSTLTLVDGDCLHWTGPFTLCAEASDLRWPPGSFPLSFQVRQFTGNGNPFYIESRTEEVITYLQDLGCTRIRVFND